MGAVDLGSNPGYLDFIKIINFRGVSLMIEHQFVSTERVEFDSHYPVNFKAISLMFVKRAPHKGFLWVRFLLA